MGIILSCIGIASNSYQKQRKQKKAAHLRDAANQPQSLVAQGSQDEHPASQHLQAPSTHINSAGRASEAPQESGNTGTGGISTTVKGVGREAPVPIAKIAKSNTNTNLLRNTQGEESEGRKDKMATDEDYMAFLDKVNQDPNEGVSSKSTSKGKVELKTTDKGVTVPPVLKKATQDAFYISDSDEPFVPVCLRWEKKSLPDEASFAKLVNHPNAKDAEIQIMDIAEWDTQGQYKELVAATREAAKGSDVRVYRISDGGSRAEYWLVGLESGKLVGVKALAIES